MSWRQREQWVYWGVPLALLPALAFLPALVYLVFEPRVRHGGRIALVLLPVFVASEVIGVKWLVQCSLERPFNILTMIAGGALIILIVIAAYTGLFLAAFAFGM